METASYILLIFTELIFGFHITFHGYMAMEYLYKNLQITQADCKFQ